MENSVLVIKNTLIHEVIRPYLEMIIYVNSMILRIIIDNFKETLKKIFQ